MCGNSYSDIVLIIYYIIGKLLCVLKGFCFICNRDKNAQHMKNTNNPVTFRSKHYLLLDFPGNATENRQIRDTN